MSDARAQMSVEWLAKTKKESQAMTNGKNGCDMAPHATAADRVLLAKEQLAQAERNLAKAKLAEVNEQVRKAVALSDRLPYPHPALVITSSGPRYIAVAEGVHLESQCANLLIIACDERG